MNDSKTRIPYTGIDRRAPRMATSGASLAQGLTPAVLTREVHKTGGRHAAITNHLYNWHSYKNWADKMKGSWEDKK